MNRYKTLDRINIKLRYLAATLMLCVAFGSSAQQVPTQVAPPAQVQPSQVAAPVARRTTTSAPRTLIAGRDYLVLAKPMPAPPDRLEVAYFFWYNSPASANFDPLIRSWAASKASPLVKFRPLPAVLQNNWGYGARVYFALVALNKEATIGPKLFLALSQGIVDYNSPKSLSNWLRDQGVSLQDLNKAINSPGVIAQTSWIPSLMRRYGVERVPTVVIDGQFLFIASPNEKPEAFLSRISFASEALTQRKLRQLAAQRKKEAQR